MHNVVRTLVLLDALELSNTPQVTTGGHHNQSANGKLDSFLDLASLQVELDRVVLLDGRVWVADGATIVAANSWDSLATSVSLSHFQQLELASEHRSEAIEFRTISPILSNAYAGLFRGNLVQSKFTLDGVEQSVVLLGLLNLDNI